MKEIIRKVLRGSSWDFLARLARSAFRYGDGPDYRVITLGFRTVRKKK